MGAIDQAYPQLRSDIDFLG